MRRFVGQQSVRANFVVVCSPRPSRSTAVSRVSNQDVLSNSFRTLALNASAKALSVGFPGREKSSSIRLLYAHWSSASAVNSVP